MRVCEYGIRYWTEADDQMLIEYHNERYPVKDIAKAMHRSFNSVRQRKKRLHLTRILKMDVHNICRRRANQRRRAEQCTN